MQIGLRYAYIDSLCVWSLLLLVWVCLWVCDSACFGRLEEMCSCLLSMQVQLQRMWDEKGAKLDQVVQLRKYEHDSAQVCGITCRPAAVVVLHLYRQQ